MKTGWNVKTKGSANGRHFEAGDELTVRDHNGRRRRVRFRCWVDNGTEEWIDVAEVDQYGRFVSMRSFRPDRILTVHRDRKLGGRRR